MNRLLQLLWATLALLTASAATAQTFPQLTGRVVDQANLLRPEQEVDLASKAAALEQRTGRQLVIATVGSLEGRPIEDYGYRLGRHWAIGDEKRDDGVILLVAPNEKKVRIETGYGARVFLTDAISSVIIRESILPRFRQGDFGGGITAGAEQIIRMMSLTEAEAQRRNSEAAQTEARKREKPNFMPVIFIMIIFFVMLSSVARRARGMRYHPRGRRRRRGGMDAGDLAIMLWGLNALGNSRGRGGWGGGGGFGGFGGGGGSFGGFSGGGGSFGGGGASGGW